ncbi:hypothetical protein DRI50_06630 [candidate division KSB1 bacterium]|nr:MAG: hypothetical protein DRI50_06630 [candidate division KSB1 bacterium]
MRKFFTLLFLILPVMLFSQASDLFISEYIEGSSNNKALEIFNGTGAPVDLSQYQIWRISNGGSWPEYTLQLKGTLKNDSVYVIANNQAGQTVKDKADTLTSFASWNGDDAVGLAKDDGTGNYVLIDAVGEDGDDPGSGWDVAGVSNATKDHTLIRKSDVTSGTTDWAASAGTDTDNSQWIVEPKDYFDDLGRHTFNPANNTTVQFDTSKATVNEGDGTFDIVVTITNPDPNNATTANVVLTSGDPADIGNYTTQSVTFPAGSSDNQIVTITITDDSEVEGDEEFVFELQNVSGGNNAMAGTPSQFTLTIEDNDHAAVPDIVMNEIMQNPAAVNDDKGEWFELYNNDAQTVDINSWIIKDDGSDYHVIDNGGPLTIDPGDYLVLGINDTMSVNGGVPVDYMYDHFLLSNGEDEVVLVYSDGITEVDRVNYDNGATFPDPSGKSMELKNPNLDNNVGSNWDVSSSPYGDGDLGTPGAKNSDFVSGIENFRNQGMIIDRYQIFPNFPNPFNPSTTFRIAVPRASKVEVGIYDITGKLVNTLFSGELAKGIHSYQWQGKNNQGKPVPSGIYFAVLRSENATHSIKMMLIK